MVVIDRGEDTMKMIAIAAVGAIMLAPAAYSPLLAATTPKYIKIKSCSVSPPACYVVSRTTEPGGPSSKRMEPSAVAPTGRIRAGCYDGVGVYLAPCTSKKHLDVLIVD